MIEILITLPEDVVQYMDEDPYIGDRSKFIAWLIRRFQKEVERSRQESEESMNDPKVFHDP